MSLPKIALIILNWNQKQDTLECLRSVSAIEYPNVEIIVADNGSNDGSPEEIQQQFPHILLLRYEKNLGFAEGNNRAMKIALERGATYLLLLNNDTVVSPDFLTFLEEAARHYPQAGVFGPKIYFYEEPATLWFAGARWDPRHARFFSNDYKKADHESQHTSIEETPFIVGCALFIRRTTIEQVGMMEEKFFLNWEEIDWCARIRKAGFSCLLVPQARIWHKGSASFIGGHHGPMWEYFFWRNRLFFFERNFSKRTFCSLFCKVLIRELFGLLRQLFSRKTASEKKKSIRAAFLGIRDYVFRRFGSCPAYLFSPKPKNEI